MRSKLAFFAMAALQSLSTAAVAGPSWTGCYAGVALGYSWAGSGTTDLPFNSGPLAGQGFAWNTAADPRDTFGLSGDGTSAGAHVGCDIEVMQTGLPIVLGALVDGAAADWDVSGQSSLSADTQASFSADWTATIRGRVGYSTGNVLLYVSGGAAWAGLTARAWDLDVSQGPGQMSVEKNATRLGWVVGLGAEWRLGAQTSAQVDYMHLEFGGVEASGAAISPVAAFPQFAFNDIAVDELRIALNWRM